MFKFFNILVFVNSFSLMATEVVASRIMAPYLGVSLFTWASIISAFLAGMALGSYCGGKIADTRGSESTLGWIFILSGGIMASAVLLATPSAILVQNFSLPSASLIYSLLVFFPPAFSMSLVLPIVIKLKLKDLARTGEVVGRTYTWSNLGSIAGTLATGFYLISRFGTKALTSGLAATIFLIGILILGFKIKSSKRLYILSVLILIISSFFVPKTCLKETSYFCIRIQKSISLVGEGYGLVLDGLLHSVVLPDKDKGVHFFWYDNLRIFAQLVAMEKNKNDNFSVLHLGGGGYIEPRYLEKNYPQSENIVVEIDPVITAINHQVLFLNLNTKIKTHNEDARIYLKKLNLDEKFDFIFEDVFNDQSVPFHLTTKEFNELAKKHLSTDGFYAVHLIDNYKKGGFLSSYIKTLRLTFKNVYLFGPRDWKEKERTPFTIVGSDMEIDRAKWDKTIIPIAETRYSKRDDKLEVSQLSIEKTDIIKSEEVDEFLNSKQAMILTDDFVPVDQLLYSF